MVTRRRVVEPLEAEFSVLAVGGFDGVAEDDRGGEEDGAADQAGDHRCCNSVVEAGSEADEEHDHADAVEQVANAVGELGPLGDGRSPHSYGIGFGHVEHRGAPVRSEPTSATRRFEMAVTRQWHDRVLLVTIDRPERRNAVDHATLLELLAAQAEALHGNARVLVLTGAPPAFCAGADLTGVESGTFTDTLLKVLRGFGSLGIATIAAIEGPALGAGTQLAIACDLRVATPGSVFGIPAAKLGLAVDRWTIDRLAREAGASVARDMLLTASAYRSDHAALAGFVHRSGGLVEALAWAQEIAALAPLTIATHKLGLELAGTDAAADSAAVEKFEAERTRTWASADAEEGRTAFLEKRRAEFTGE